MLGWTMTRPRSATKSLSTGISTFTTRHARSNEIEADITRLEVEIARTAEGAWGMSYFAHSNELPEWAAQAPEDWDNNWLKWSIELSTERPDQRRARDASIHLQ